MHNVTTRTLQSLDPKEVPAGQPVRLTAFESSVFYVIGYQSTRSDGTHIYRVTTDPTLTHVTNPPHREAGDDQHSAWLMPATIVTPLCSHVHEFADVLVGADLAPMFGAIECLFDAEVEFTHADDEGLVPRLLCHDHALRLALDATAAGVEHDVHTIEPS